MLDVGGIGFELLTTRSAERLARRASMVTVETYLHVREDALQLFGFADAGERSLFKLLMGVSGIGPKLALAIVSAYGPEQLQRAIAGQDVALLASVSGVGRKTAQRICVDLKGKVGGVGAAAVASANGAAAVAAPGCRSAPTSATRTTAPARRSSPSATRWPTARPRSTASRAPRTSACGPGSRRLRGAVAR